jgi:hypothetical protein
MYECKGRHADCCNCINQDKLLPQLFDDLLSLELAQADREELRELLVQECRRQSGGLGERRGVLEDEYKRVERQVGDLFTQRADAERMGLVEALDAKLAGLKARKDELQGALQRSQDESNDWIEHVVRCFELQKLATEAIKYGSPAVRQAMLKALGSNYYVRDKVLICDWVSPFLEKAKSPDRTIWLLGLDSNQGPWR